MTFEFNTALDLIAKLDEAFPGTQSLIVGGAVRDYFLNVPAHDVDIATNVPFEQLALYFELQDITKNTVNAQPVSIIVHCGVAFEIAQFRTDSTGTDRKSNVATVVSTFEEDSARRDITINAIGLDRNQKIIDPQGGRQDLINELVTCVGDADTRFQEDATRILRVLRFAAKLNFSIHPDTLDAVIRNCGLLTDRERISPESIAKEIFKAAHDGVVFARFIQLLDLTGISSLILREWIDLNGFTHDPIHHPEGGSTVQGHILECLVQGGFTNDPVANIGIFCHDLGKAVTRGVKDNGQSNYHGHEGAGVPIVEALFDRLRFNDLSSGDKEDILFATEKHMLVHNLRELSTRTIARLVLSKGWNVLKQVAFADEASRGPDLFNREEFTAKIAWAEEKVRNIAKNRDELRLRVKEHVDGNKLLEWFPVLQSNRKLLSPLLEFLAEFILETIDLGETPSQEDIKSAAASELRYNLLVNN
jgi:tRNA nucleotidyltransferase (CCA-adding enzyme)